MGGANQYRATSEWPSELQTESLQWVVGSDGFLPLSGSTNQDNGPFKAAGIGQQAQFLLVKEGKPEAAVVNGYLIDLNKEEVPEVPNVFGY